MANDMKKKNDPTGLLFVGCLMVGMALGFLYNNFVVGMFLGLGVGFIAMFVGRMLLRKGNF